MMPSIATSSPPPEGIAFSDTIEVPSPPLTLEDATSKEVARIANLPAVREKKFMEIMREILSSYPIMCQSANKELPKDFGILRDEASKSGRQNSLPTFTVIDPHNICHEKLMERIQRVLVHIEPSPCKKPLHSIESRTAPLFDNNLLTVQFTSRAALIDAACENFPSLKSLKIASNDPTISKPEDVWTNFDRMLSFLKNASTPSVNAVFYSTILREFERSFPRSNPNTHLVTFSLKSAPNHKFLLMKLFIYLNNKEEDPYKYMKQTSVLIMHASLYQFRYFLQAAQHLFNQVMSWQPLNGEDRLKKNIAKFRYMFTLSHPFEKGNRAIIDIFERIILYHHGYQNPRLDPEARLDLCALVSIEFGNFLTDYISAVDFGENHEPLPVSP